MGDYARRNRLTNQNTLQTIIPLIVEGYSDPETSKLGNKFHNLELPRKIELVFRENLGKKYFGFIIKEE